MSIILENQTVNAGVTASGAGLHIEFTEDPSYTRSEAVLIDLMQRSIGIIFQNGYHHIGDLPKHLGGPEIEKMTNVRLTGHGEGGREIELHAPIKLIRRTDA